SAREASAEKENSGGAVAADAPTLTTGPAAEERSSASAGEATSAAARAESGASSPSAGPSKGAKRSGAPEGDGATENAEGGVAPGARESGSAPEKPSCPSGKGTGAVVNSSSGAPRAPRSARRKAWDNAHATRGSSRKRISRLVGWTFT